MSNLLLTLNTLGDRLWQSIMLHMIVLARRLSVTLTAQYLSLVNASLLVYECMPVSVIVSDCQGVSRCQYQPDGTQDLWLLTTKHQTRYYCQQSQQSYRVCEITDQGLRREGVLILLHHRRIITYCHHLIQPTLSSEMLRHFLIRLTNIE